MSETADSRAKGLAPVAAAASADKPANVGPGKPTPSTIQPSPISPAKPEPPSKIDTSGVSAAQKTTGLPENATATSPAPTLPAPAITSSSPVTSATAASSPRSTTAASAKEANGAVTASPNGSITTATTTAKDDQVNPPDFQGEVQTNNELPSAETIRKLEDHTVLDADGKSHTFKSLYSGTNVARRVLVIFVRHFFCGNCQEYLRMLSASITPEALLGLPVPTFIAVVGCGAPELINAYVAQTNCPYPVYADPTRRLYNELGMVRTLAMGSRPAYMQNKTVAHTVMSGIVQGLKQVKSGLVLKMGDQRQVGGEFLFEPASMSVESPIATPSEEKNHPLDLDEKTEPPHGEEKKVTWCHRMKSTRDHAEIPELMEVLGLDSQGMPTPTDKRWEKALKSRKGTGLSMASRMSRMSLDAKGLARFSSGEDEMKV